MIVYNDRVMKLPRLFATVIAFVLCAPIAAAQSVQFGTISNEEFAIYARWLRLDGDERAVHQSLIDDQRKGVSRIEAALSNVRAWDERLADEGIDRHMPSPPQAVMNRSIAQLELPARIAAQRESVHLAGRYIAALHMNFPDRGSTITSIERSIRRVRMLGSTAFIGSAPHVPNVMFQIDRIAPELIAHPDSRSVIEVYEREVDRLLRDRERLFPEAGDWMRFQNEGDVEGLARAIESPLINEMHLRNATRRAMSSVRAFMDQRTFQEFESALLEAFYPPRPEGRLGVAHMRWLQEQPGLTEDEHRRFIEADRNLDAAFADALPKMRQRYDAFYTRATIRAFAQEMASARIERRMPSHTHAPFDWHGTATPEEMRAAIEHFHAETDAINYALSQRQDVLARTAAPAQDPINPSTNPLWLPALSSDEFARAIELLAADETVAEMMRDLQRQFRHVFIMESRRNLLTFAALWGEAAKRFDDHVQIGEWASREGAKNRMQWAEFRLSYEMQFRDEIAMLLEGEDQRRRWINLHSGAYLENSVRAARDLTNHRRMFDLVSVIENAGLFSEEDQPDVLLNDALAYRGALNDAMEALLRQYPERSLERDNIMRQGPHNAERVHAAESRVRALGEPIERLNEQWLPRFIELFPDREREIRESVRRAQYAGVYRISPAERAFELLDEADDLDEPMRLQFDALRDRFDRELESIRNALIDAIRRYESTGPAGRADAHATVIERILRQQDLVERACRDIRRIVPAEAFEEMPSDVRLLMSWME